MGFWGDFLSSLTLGAYTPKDRKVNNSPKASQRITDAIFYGFLKSGMTISQVKALLEPAIPFEPECNFYQLVYKYSINSGNKITWYSLKLIFDYEGKLVADGYIVK